MDVVSLLIRHEPVCPVIVHTSLPAESAAMARALREHGWTVVLFNKREAVADWRDAVQSLAGHLAG